MKSSFCFVLTPLEVDADLPFEIIPGHFLQRANQLQLRQIKEKLVLYLEPMIAPQYEFDWVPQAGGGQGYAQQPLAEGAWRYWVISFKGASPHLQTLGFATSLLQTDVELGFSFHYLEEIGLGGGTGFLWSDDFLSSFFKSARGRIEEVARIATANLQEISDNYTALRLAENSHPNIFRAVNRFHSLKALPRQSSMLVIGYFSIIEALIAHKARLQESLDSINHQLQAKLILLAKRFQRRLDYANHFGQTAEEKIWKLLYGYRSAIAHDTLVNVDSEFKGLRGQANVIAFLNEVVKLLLLLGLKEPVFLADLKNC